MFNFCPSCASEKISFEQGKLFFCPDCDFKYYHNTAAAAGCIISIPSEDRGERLLFIIRGREPGKGKLDLPGGFVDPGEGVVESLYRELQEEIGWSPPIPAGASLTGAFQFFASFPNKYPYKGVLYNTCDSFFSVSAPELRESDLHLERAEIAGVRILKPEEIDFKDIAFESARMAIRAYLDFIGRP
ncbi:MAG: NUDIX domain-containing protein [Treponema sp.]|nr:NUDIX domain-containing protein [Treponema sp.]